MRFEGWYLLLGALMLGVTFLDHWVRRLPITTTLVYLAVGLVLGPLGTGLASIDPSANSAFLERVTELAVIVSLFTAGLKLQATSTQGLWKLPLRLAFLSMTITVGLIAVFGALVLQLPWGAAILLGAILAPTDPVLASEVQLESPKDRDKLRFSLTGEAGLNDGTAFPFVMLGLGLLGLHEIGSSGWRWVMVDVIWAVTGGLGIGWLFGIATGKLIVALGRKHEETLGRDEFISLGLIGLSYGAALYAHTYGFLAVFAAALALRKTELQNERSSGNESGGGPRLNSEAASPRRVARGVLNANEQLERILEIGVVLMIGMMLSSRFITAETFVTAAVLFFVIRPAAVWVGVFGERSTLLQKLLMSWFGIRGIGSLYYLMHAVEFGLGHGLAEQLIGIVTGIVALSIFIHGISVTPVMSIYEKRSTSPKGSA